MLLKAGFKLLPKRGKGSHSIYRHPLLSEDVKLSGKDGNDAKPYQEKNVRQAIQEIKRHER
ncbi:MAG: type II toxin-antitoxin system HicA family toxin [Xenococcaceae cyanobacterium MO_188.B19]|nr:type II toxin-antitoxin system HicA family toxin [Xenococcaceae cyanobacterium MO_188.B19]